jgi:toluene monooxygenase system protein B
MALVPLTGAFRGDFVVQLVPVEDTDTMNVVAEKVAAHAVGLRVAPRDAPMVVLHNGEAVADDTTVTEAGIGPMDFVEVRYAEH